MTEQKNKERYCSLSALRYAEVLYQMDMSEDVIDETGKLWKESPELKEALENPVVSKEQKHKVIDRIFPERIRSFLKVLTDHGKAGILEEIFQAYEEKKRAAKGIVTAVLRYTALPTREQQEQMEKFICRTMNAASVRWELQEDASLVGGFILSVGDKEYDYSVQGRLNRLEQKLTWR
nr:ATP synthase F1 subunit delta [uncultured Merdimonas sp.]